MRPADGFAGASGSAPRGLGSLWLSEREGVAVELEPSGVDVVGLIHAIGYWVFGFVGVVIGATLGLQLIKAGMAWARQLGGPKS